MRKAITYSGNSFALVLDKAICKMIGIGHGSIVELSIEDGRLIIERTGESRKMVARDKPGLRQEVEVVPDRHEPVIRVVSDEPTHTELEQYAKAVLDHLMGRGLDRYLDRIHYDAQVSPTLFSRRFSFIDPETAAPRDVVVLRRLRATFDEVRHGVPIHVAVDMAATRYPFDKSDAMSAGSGAEAATSPPSGCGKTTRAA